MERGSAQLAPTTQRSRDSGGADYFRRSVKIGQRPCLRDSPETVTGNTIEAMPSRAARRTGRGCGEHDMFAAVSPQGQYAVKRS